MIENIKTPEEVPEFLKRMDEMIDGEKAIERWGEAKNIINPVQKSSFDNIGVSYDFSNDYINEF